MSDFVDLSPYYLLVATPSMDGAPSSDFMLSLDHTKQIVQGHGGKIDFAMIKYVADISYSRAKIIRAFLDKKEATHLLMVDDDMGWKAEEVAYMLLLQRDFLAVVGCKKKYPIEFAYNMMDDDAKLRPLYWELETNVAEVPFVGGAFVMISRQCAEKMVEKYQDLTFEDAEGKDCVGLFDPVYLVNANGEKKRRLSEDYAFCWRWRQCGGKVQVKMDVELTHTGNHTFRGCLLEELKRTDFGYGEQKGA